MLTTPPPCDRQEHGFTLIELMIVSAVLVVVLAIAGGTLISVTQATNRSNARVDQQQAIATTLDDLARDLRSADALVIPSGASAGTAIELLLNNAAGGTTAVEWSYAPATRQLSRTAIAGGATTWSLSNVVNSTSIFSYYNDQGAPLTTSIVACSTRVHVAFAVGSPVAGVPSYADQDDIALTDRVQILSVPGNNQC